jgi:hypothetical protein
VKIPYPQRELMAREEAGGFRLADDRREVRGADNGGTETAVEPVESSEADEGPGTHMSAVTDPTVEIDTDGDETLEPRSTDGEFIAAIERVEGGPELSEPIEPMDREDD